MIRETRTDRIFNICNKIFLFIVLVIVLYPLIYIVSASISDPAAVNQGRMWLYPIGVTLEGYVRVFQNSDIWMGYRNTVFYTLLGVTINLLLTLPAGYALSRPDFVGRNIFTWLIVFTLFFSGGLIPTYLLVRDLGLLNTVWAMVLPNAVAAFNIIICRTFFQVTIPRELQDAAEIDGCSITAFFLRIVLPLSKPLIAVMALFYGVGHWNAYFNALIYLSDRDLYPLQLILREILVVNEMSTEMLSTSTAQAQAEQARIAEIIKYAVMIVAALPVIVIYPFLQRYFVKGVLIGSIKG